MGRRKAFDYREIAEYCCKHTADDAARHFGCSVGTVRNACQAHDIKPIRGGSGGIPNPSTFVALKQIMQGASDDDIATKMGVSRQRVNQIRQLAKQAELIRK